MIDMYSGVSMNCRRGKTLYGRQSMLSENDGDYLESGKVVETIEVRGRTEQVVIGDRTGKLYRSVEQKVSLNMRVRIYEDLNIGVFYFKELKGDLDEDQI